MWEVENRMVIDSYHIYDRNASENKLNGPGYRNLTTDVFVPEEDAFRYALEQCVHVVPEGFNKIEWHPEFQDMVIDWFYDEDWIKED